jgi:hypothetical protein
MLIEAVGLGSCVGFENGEIGGRAWRRAFGSVCGLDDCPVLVEFKSANPPRDALMGVDGSRVDLACRSVATD